MPIAKIKTSLIGASMEVNYNIATPTNASAKSIDKSLPTVIFLHPVYISSPVFHNQLNDPTLRKFNCVTVDSRGHGNTNAKISKHYGPAQAAEDVVKLMDSLKISKAHLYGISMGSITAIHVAMSFPDRCLSVYMLSPLSIREPEDVFAGRQEIAEYWAEGCNDNPDAHHDAMYGAAQLAFSNELEGLAEALVKHELPGTLKRWNAKNLNEYRITTVDFFQADRDMYSKQGFSRVQCPVKLLFCSEDVAYTLEHAKDLLGLMEDSGMTVSMEQVPTCHFGNVKKPAEINRSFDLFLREVDASTASLSVPAEAVSPFEEILKAAGYVDGDLSD